MTLHVIFTPEGIPGWIGSDPREGSEPIDDVSIEFLAANLRRPNGKWVKRPAPTKPTAEEREAARVAERERERLAVREDRRAARDAARRDRLFDRLVDVAARIDPDFAAEVAKLEAEFKDGDDD